MLLIPLCVCDGLPPKMVISPSTALRSTINGKISSLGIFLSPSGFCFVFISLHKDSRETKAFLHASNPLDFF